MKLISSNVAKVARRGFKANDKDSMMSWIGAIQRNNNPDEDKSGVTSESLIIRRKKNMDCEISSGQPTSKQMPPASLKISGLKKSLSFKSNSGSQSSFKKKPIDGDSSKAAWHNKVVNKMKKIGGTSTPIPQYQIPGFTVGVQLERCVMSKTNPSLPLLVEHCCQVVENKGLESVGIYRVPGNSANVAALEEELTKTPDAIDFEDPKWNDANNMGSLLKKFLRKLPEGLVTSELYNNFIEANRKEGEDRMWALKHLVQQLPGTYGETLTFLIRHLKKVSEHSDKNKMEIRNLAIVFGPTIVRTGEDNMMTMVNDMSDRFRIVESFITNFDWFFDNEPTHNGEGYPALPNSPPVEDFSGHIVSSNTLNSIGQAAVTFESTESGLKIKSPTIKLPNFKNFMKHGSDSSRKTEHSPEQRSSPEPGDQSNFSVNLLPFGSSHRPSGGSQPSSPTAGRRKIIKRHHSSTNISSMENHDDFDRSKSEGEDEESVFYARPSHATKAYSYARPPPPSYRDVRSKGGIRGQHSGNNTPSPQTGHKEINVSSENSDSRDFNSLSEETKRRLLSFSLRKKVSEKKKQKTAQENESSNTTQNRASEDSQKVIAATPIFINVPDNRKLSNSSTAPSSTTADQTVVIEPQMKPSEVKKMFESSPEDKKGTTVQEKTSTNNSVAQLRRRDGPVPSSSSRNFKIYSKAEVNFCQYQPNQINEWVREMGQEEGLNGIQKPRGDNERGRSRSKADDSKKGMRRSASVSRTSFIQDDEERVMKRRSLSCQDINLGDDDIFNRSSTFSKSSDSTDSSDEEGDPFDASSKSFDEKLRGLLQKSKLENKSKTEFQPVRKTSQVNRPASHRASRTCVEKMRAMDPTSKIQSGAVSSMKSLFESGTPHQHVSKSRSSSLSSNSSGSLLSTDTQRRKSNCSSNTLSDADVKRRVWESDSSSTGSRKQWKEPVWLAKERAIKNLNSESASSFQSDDNNNVKSDQRNDVVLKQQYSRSTSLPLKQTEYSTRDTFLRSDNLERKVEADTGKTSVEKKIDGEPTLSRSKGMRTPPTVKKVMTTNTSAPTLMTAHKVVQPTKSYPSGPANADEKPSTHNRRRIVSETSHRRSPESRHPSGRTFTAPILGTVVTTTTAFELEGFEIKPECKSRSPRGRKSGKKDTGYTDPWQADETLPLPESSVPESYGCPMIRRKTTLTVPAMDDAKRLSTDRRRLEQNALHIKELLDEMNTEHSLKMERQKSDTISMNAQKAAKNRAMRRRLSLGQDRDSAVVVASCVSPSNTINDHSRNETKASLSTTKNDLQRNLSTVKWVGVSS